MIGEAMRLRSSRKVLLWLSLAIAIAAAAIEGPRLHRRALLGSGFMAQTLCAELFISGRHPREVLAEDLAGPGYELLRYFQPEIDRDAQRVTVSLYGLAGQTAIFRQGLGCTRLTGRSEAELRAEASGLFSLSEPPVPDAPWPDGEQMALGPRPDGVDGAALAKAVDSAFSEPDPSHPRRIRALVVVHSGRIVAERYAEGFDAKMPLIGWSMSKTATNALVGLRVKDGKLVLDDKMLLPEWREKGDPRGAISIYQLLRMTSGLLFDESYDDDLSDVVEMLFVEGDAAAFAASKPLEFPAGSHWAYSSGTTNILSRVLRASFAERRDYLRFPYERLFKPLGMRSAVLQPDASGTFVASSFLYASARDWARLGLFFLRKGRWGDEQLLPEAWVGLSLVPTKSPPNIQFGAHVWLRLPDTPGLGEPPMPGDAYYMLGHDRQVVAVVPSRDLVIVRLGLTREGGSWDTARELAPIANAFPSRAF